MNADEDGDEQVVGLRYTLHKLCKALIETMADCTAQKATNEGLIEVNSHG